MSLVELWREFAVARAKQHDEMTRDKALAWHVALLMWQKKLPALKDFLNPVPKGRQTRAEQKAVLMQLADQYGIPLRTRPGPS